MSETLMLTDRERHSSITVASNAHGVAVHTDDGTVYLSPGEAFTLSRMLREAAEDARGKSTETLDRVRRAAEERARRIPLT